MILQIAELDHPALRTMGRPILKVDEKLLDLVEDMIETMQNADGIGLAAQQVGRPLQMFVLDVPKMQDRPSTMTMDGKAVDFEDFMPLVILNPKIETFGELATENEGCLSFPGLHGDVTRPRSVRVAGQGLEGESIAFEAEGLLARAVQHEYDHLQGHLFLDRMIPEHLAELPRSVQKLVRSVHKPF